MPTKTEHTITTIGIFIQVISGSAGLLAMVGSLLSILLTLVSILAGVLVIAVNWEKGSNQFRKWMKKKDKNDLYIKKK